MPRVLIAPDKFKGSLSAVEVARAIASGIQRVRPHADVIELPVADGGDGTVAAAVAAGFSEVPLSASGPTGERVFSRYARRGDLAVVELADVCGLVRLPGGVKAPLTASSRGLGEAIGAIVRDGCREIIVGIGGSASTDGGAGLLRGLGAVLQDAAGRDLGEGGAALVHAQRLDLRPVRELLNGVRVTIASDVDNPLTGPQGAAAVYGPQKGAGPADVTLLDSALTHWADLIAASTGNDLRSAPGSGAAGGVGFVALAVLGSVLRPGIEVILELVDFRTRLHCVDLVVTGEGSLDEQTLHGKAPAGVAAAARAAGITVVAVCGQNLLTADRLADAGITAAYALTDLETDLHRCIANAAQLLHRVGAEIAAIHLKD